MPEQILLNEEPQESSSSNILDSFRAFNQRAGNTVNGVLAEESDLSSKDLFPGLSDNINKGTFSGSEIGSVPIFVPSGDIFPVEIINRRARALGKFAKKEIDAKNKAFDALTKDPIKSAAQFQGAVEVRGAEVLDKYGKKHNYDYRKVKQDPEYQKEIGQLKGFGAMSVQTNTALMDIRKSVAKGETQLRNKDKEKIAFFEAGIADPSVFEKNPKKMNEAVAMITAIQSTPKALAEWGGKIKTDTFSGLGDKQSELDGAIKKAQLTGDKTGIFKVLIGTPQGEQIDAMANGFAKSEVGQNLGLSKINDEGVLEVTDLDGSRNMLMSQVLESVSITKLAVESQKDLDLTDQKIDASAKQIAVNQRKVAVQETNAQTRKDELKDKEETAKLKASAAIANKNLVTFEKVKGYKLKIDDKDEWINQSGEIQANNAWGLTGTYKKPVQFSAGDAIFLSKKDDTVVGKSGKTKIYNGTPTNVVQSTVFIKDVLGEDGNVMFTAGSLTSGLDDTENSSLRDKDGNLKEDVKTNTKQMLFIEVESDADRVLLPYNENKKYLGNVRLNGVDPALVFDVVEPEAEVQEAEVENTPAEVKLTFPEWKKSNKSGTLVEYNRYKNN